MLHPSIDVNFRERSRHHPTGFIPPLKTAPPREPHPQHAHVRAHHPATLHERSRQGATTAPQGHRSQPREEHKKRQPCQSPPRKVATRKHAPAHTRFPPTPQGRPPHQRHQHPGKPLMSAKKGTSSRVRVTSQNAPHAGVYRI